MKNFKTFIFKCICFISPILLLIGLYVYNDPFKVLRKYKTYDTHPLFLNESCIGWRTYLNFQDSLHFNSFILGNSCTMAYKTQEWEKYLQAGKAIRLYGNAEGLGEVCQKLKALDRQNIPISNLLFIFDKSLLQKTQPSNNYMFVLPPDVSGKSNFSFQMYFLQGFLNPKFLIPYLDYKLFHHYRSYMNGMINLTSSQRNLITNDQINPSENEIREIGTKYWKNRSHLFYTRSGQYQEYPPVINGASIKLLKEIDSIIKKRHTQFKIIINPNYSQQQFNPSDLAKLQQIFGPENVFDFSGINNYTNDIHNFYETVHYRDTLGQQILKQIYAAQNRNEVNHP